MLRLTLIASLLLLAAAVTAAAPEIVVPAGTQLSATTNAIIDSGTMIPGDEVNFTLAQDVKGPSQTIAKGSVIFGRVVEVEKFSGNNTPARVVIMFDFLQVGEEFYSMTGLILSGSGAQKELQLQKSDSCEGCTSVTMKGGDIKIPEGTAFVIKVEKDIES